MGSTVSMDTVAALLAALDSAKAGMVLGVATIEFYDDGFRVIVTGSARANPALTAATLCLAYLDQSRDAISRASPASKVFRYASAFERRKAPGTVATAGALDGEGAIDPDAWSALEPVPRALDTV